MKISEIRIMRGPNFWCIDRPEIIVAHIQFEENENLPDEESIYSLPEKCFKLLTQQALENNLHEPKAEHTFSYKGAQCAIAHLVKNLALAMQQMAGIDVSFGDVKESNVDNRQVVYFEYKTEKAGQYSAQAGFEMVEAMLQGKHFDAVPYIEKIKSHFYREYLGPSTDGIVQEVRKKGIPVIGHRGAPFIQLGYGAFQKRISATITNNTGTIAVDIAGDKYDTKMLLDSFNIPVPKGVIVYDRHDLKDALDAVGYPVVIKPLDGNQGKGATINVNDWSCALKGFLAARKFSKGILVETFITGHDYRLLVVNKKFVAAALRTPACVKGDGRSTIKELIEEINKDPKRGSGHEKVLTKIKVDEMSRRILKDKNYTLSSVLKKDEILHLKDTANLSTGGTATDVTEIVHPENIFMAEQIAQIVGLDICGIDVMTPDISIPLRDARGAILEVNAAPGFRMHTHPAFGKPRNVSKAVADMLFPVNEKYTMPIVAITGTNGKTTTTRLIAHIAKMAGFNVGFTNTDGIYIQDKLMEKGDCSGPMSAQFVLRNPSVDFAVLECARGGILRSGLGFLHCHTAVVTNIASDHLGIGGINTLEELAEVKSVVPRSVLPNGYAVLNACDDRVFNMLDNLNCKIALYGICDTENRIGQHCHNGGLGAVVIDGYVTIVEGHRNIPIEKVESIPLTLNGRAGFNIENVLAAVLAAYTNNIPIDIIRQALLSFTPSPEQTPGRLNIFKLDNFEVMVDYAHNPAGLRALGDFLKHVGTLKVGVITGVGDRRDEDITEIGEVAAGIFDEIVIRLDDDLRGKSKEDMYSLIEKGIFKVAPDMPVTRIDNEVEAIQYAMENAQPNSFITLCTDKVQRAIDTVRQFMAKQDHAEVKNLIQPALKE